MSTVGMDIGGRRFAPYMKQLQLDEVSGHVKLVVLIHKRVLDKLKFCCMICFCRAREPGKKIG